MQYFLLKTKKYVVKNLWPFTGINVLLAVHLLNGNYVGGSRSRRASMVLRAYCVLVTMAMCYGAHYVCGKHGEMCAEYVLCAGGVTAAAAHSLFTAQRYILSYNVALDTCDRLAGNCPATKTSDRLVLILYFSAFGTSCLHLADDLTFNQLQEQLPFVICFVLLVHSLMLTAIKPTILIGLLRHRLVLLRDVLHRCRPSVNIIGNQDASEHVMFIRKCLHNYNNLLDAYDSIDVHVQYLIILMLFTHVPKLIIASYFAIKIRAMDFHEVVCYSCDMAHTFFMICAPCILSDLCRHEAESIRDALNTHYIRCSERSLRDELEYAVQTISRRGAGVSLVGAVSVDMRLPAAVIALVITYLIIVLQFTYARMFESGNGG